MKLHKDPFNTSLEDCHHFFSIKEKKNESIVKQALNNHINLQSDLRNYMLCLTNVSAPKVYDACKTRKEETERQNT